MRSIIGVIALFLFISCTSKEQKVLNTLETVTKQYIKDVENASSLAEVNSLQRAYDERVRFECNKLSEEEKIELERSLDWEVAQYYNNLVEQERQAT